MEVLYKQVDGHLKGRWDGIFFGAFALHGYSYAHLLVFLGWSGCLVYSVLQKGWR